MPTYPARGLRPNYDELQAWHYTSHNPDGTEKGAPLLATNYASLQAAYDALPATGGVIYLPDGRYDVGAGLILTRTKPAWFVGYRMRRADPQANIPTGYGATIYSSTGATNLVALTTPADLTVNARHFAFANLNFEMTAATTQRAIYGPATNSMYIERCQFWFHDNSPADAVACYAQAAFNTNASDASWWTLLYNYCYKGALFQSGDVGVGQAAANRHIIVGNECIGKGIGTAGAKPCIGLYWNHGARIHDNNLERYPIGLQVYESFDIMAFGDAGEQVEFFYDIYRSWGGYFAPLGTMALTTYPQQKLFRLDRGAAATPQLENVYVYPSATTNDDMYKTVADATTLLNGATLNDGTTIAPKELRTRVITTNSTQLGFFGVTPVAQPAANPDTSGASLATLEAEVNQLKAALRSLGLIAT